MTIETFYNEACANCGLPRDIHLGPEDPIVSSPHSCWGDMGVHNKHQPLAQGQVYTFKCVKEE